MSKNQNIVIILDGISLLDVATIESYFIPLTVYENKAVVLRAHQQAEDKFKLVITCKDKEAYFKALKYLSACVSD